jgi:hypothetical protein
MDRDQIVEKVNWSPRAGVGISVLPEGRGILRGGYGNFVQRTPLNIGAFPSYESRTVVRLPADPSLSPVRSRFAMSSTACFGRLRRMSATSSGISGLAAGFC